MIEPPMRGQYFAAFAAAPHGHFVAEAAAPEACETWFYQSPADQAAATSPT